MRRMPISWDGSEGSRRQRPSRTRLLRSAFSNCGRSGQCFGCGCAWKKVLIGARKPVTAGIEAAVCASEEAKLAAAGVETDGLLSQRKEIGRKRAAAALAGNAGSRREGGCDHRVRDPGFCGPDGPVSTGYLVPGAGMCSHMPAPDPNQMIRYKLSERLARRRRSIEPVLLTGTLSLNDHGRKSRFWTGRSRCLRRSKWMVTDVRSLDRQGAPDPENRVFRFFRNFKRQGDTPFPPTKKAPRKAPFPIFPGNGASISRWRCTGRH